VTVRDFLRLHERGIPVPFYALNFVRKTEKGVKALARAKEVFGDTSITLLVEFPLKVEYYENLSVQDAVETGRFFEKDRGFEVLYLEYVPVLWYMVLYMKKDGSGVYEIESKSGGLDRVGFSEYEIGVKDISKRAMCRFGFDLFRLQVGHNYLEAKIGWTGCFFGEPPSRFLVKEYKFQYTI